MKQLKRRSSEWPSSFYKNCRPLTPNTMTFSTLFKQKVKQKLKYLKQMMISLLED